MGSDMVVALGRATVDGHTLFGQNSGGWRVGEITPRAAALHLCLQPGRAYAFGEKVDTGRLEIPQARQTYTVLAGQAAGAWGYRHGVNEHGVAIGSASYRSKLPQSAAGFAGGDLVRLLLERSRTASQAIDVLADLFEHHGRQPGSDVCSHEDNALLIADGVEAFAVETAAHFWVYQEIQQVRAVSDVCTIRQDWDRIAPGLSGHAIEQGWWPADGSKLDFADALCDNPIGDASALRRWGRATLLLEQQNGHIDELFIRQVLRDHYEGTHFEVAPFAGRQVPVTLCQHAAACGCDTLASMVVRLGQPGRLMSVGCAFGPPCLSVFFPIFLEGSLPEPLQRGDSEPVGDSVARFVQVLNDEVRGAAELRKAAHERFAQLQAELDHEAAEFAREGARLKENAETNKLAHLAGTFMQHCLERFESVVCDMAPPGSALAGSLSHSSR